MPGRVKAVVLLLLLLVSLPVAAQCPWTPRSSVPFRTTALDLSLDGPSVWLATGYGVQLLQNDATRIVGTAALPGSTRVVRADGRGNAYAGSGSRLYVLRGGTVVSVVRSIDAPGTINDILIAGSYLFVATSNGLAHYDILDPLNPIRTSAVLPTSSPAVSSLAAAGTRLYAADGDATLDIFTISIPSVPQRTGELETLQRATAVHTAPDGTVYVSDAFGQRTDVFSGGTTRVSQLAIGSNSFAAAANNVHFTAGPDRTLRAVDFGSTTTEKERFEYQFAPTIGTDNLIHAMARSGNKLYVAAGDIGLAVFDVGSLAPPYPLVGYRTAATTSTVMSGDRAWFADAGGTITEMKIDATGIGLTSQRTWSGGTLIHDVDGSNLLTSSAAKATLWSLTPATPTGTETTFGNTIRSAAIIGERVVALLQDGSVWAASQKLPLPAIAAMARSGAKSVFVELRSEGKTVLHVYPSADLTQTPQKLTIDGIATGGVAMNATTAAIFTFRGVNLVDLASGAVSVIPGSDRVLPRQLAFSGEHVLLLDRRTLYVYGTNGLVREQGLPAEAVMMAAQPSVAVLATSEGTAASSYLVQQPAPEIPFGSNFYTKLVTGGDRTYLLAGDRVDIFTGTTRYDNGLRVAGIIDLAATGDALFTLTGAGTVTAYSPSGAPYAQVTINEGSDALPLSIDTAGNAVWVSLSKGCLTGACQKKTLVFDPRSLAITSTMTGAVTDVVTAGTRAYALFDLPLELRVLDVADPLHPAQVLSTTAPASATSLVPYSGRIYVAGDRLYEYSESSLTLMATHLTTVVPDKAQQVRVDGSCLVITARGANPETYNAATMAPAATFDVPSAVKGMAAQSGRLILLTSHSIEVWSTTPAEPSKRRAVR
jgi:hypothetical protein